MNYTLHQLRVLQTIAKHQSVTKAAEELHLTQPAVSIQLKKLQEQFEIPLTEVIGRKLYITDFGKEVLLSGEKILSEVEVLNQKTSVYRGELSGKLKISIVSTGKYVMSYFLTEFLGSHPGLDLTMDVTNKATVVQSLVENQVDFALVSLLPENLQIETVPLLKNQLFLVMSTERHHSTIKGLQDAVEAMPLIFREQGSATRQSMEAFLKKNNVQARKKLELTSNEAVKQAVMAGMGCSIMPLIGIRNELENGRLRILPVTGLPIITHWNLIWLTNKNFSPAVSAFLKYIIDEKERIVAEKFDWYEKYV